MLTFTGLSLFLGLLVLELAVVQQTTHRWYGGRSNFDKVELALARDFQGLLNGNYAQPDALIVDYQDFPGSNAFVDSKFSGYREDS